MPMTKLRAEELFCDAVVRRGGNPWGYSVCHEWALEGAGSRQSVSLLDAECDFAFPLLSTKRAYLPLAAMDLLSTIPSATACLVSSRRELRDFLASGFPVAASLGGVVVLVGYDDRRVLSTDGWIEDDDIFATKLIAISESPAWTARR